MFITFIKKRTKYNSNFLITINNKKTKMKVNRIKDFNDFKTKMLNRKKMNYNEGFFKYKQYGFSSFLLNFNVDLVFVDNDGKVIEIYKKFENNKMTKYIPNSKFLYIFPSNYTSVVNITKKDIIQHERLIEKKWYE